MDAFLAALEAHVHAAFGEPPVPPAAADGGRLDGAAGEPVIARARHRHQLLRCAAALDAFLARPGSIDMAAEELRLGVRALAAITGRVDVEELLDVVFSSFCIGK